VIIYQDRYFSQNKGIVYGLASLPSRDGKGTFKLPTNCDINENYPAIINRQKLCKAFGLDISSLKFVKQIHSNRVIILNNGNDVFGVPEADGQITNNKSVFLCVHVADCVPLFLYDPIKKVIGMLHAGWRGTLAKIAFVGVKSMSAKFNCKPSDIHAWIGPCIDVCCFVVGRDIFEQFDNVFGSDNIALSKVTLRINLKELNKEQLIQAGLPPDNISTSEHCTRCVKMLCSYRREGNNVSHMLGFIGLMA